MWAFFLCCNSDFDWRCDSEQLQGVLLNTERKLLRVGQNKNRENRVVSTSH